MANPHKMTSFGKISILECLKILIIKLFIHFCFDYSIIYIDVALIIEEENKATQVQNRKGGESRQVARTKSRTTTQTQY